MNTKIRIVNPNEYSLPSPPAWIGSWYIRWRFLIFAALCLVIAASENFIEPLLVNELGSAEFLENLIFVVGIAAVAMLAEILLRTLVAKSAAVELLEIKHELSGRLEMAPDWNKLIDLILAFCEAVSEANRVALLLGTESGGLELLAQSQTKEYLQTHVGQGAGEDDYCLCAEAATKTLHKVQLSSERMRTAPYGYCLPLVAGGRMMAKLNFFLPEGHSLDERQTSILRNCASDIAFALSTAKMRKVQESLLVEQVRNSQRHEISRNLHDSLAQKLIYLRFKLDQLVNSSGERQLGEIHEDLGQMLVIANESSELVRSTLAVLNSAGPLSLAKLLIEHSKLTADRTQWELRFHETGSSQPLLPEAMQQLLYIFGEALSNVERHAAAQKVAVELEWGEAALVMKIADDGRGFEIAAAQQEGHYGLSFMRERIQTLGGCMKLQSASGEGTCLTIDIPIGDNESREVPRDMQGFGVTKSAG